MKRSFTWLLVMTLAVWAGSISAENWPRFRGPTGQGVSSETDLPLHWSATSNVAWKTPISGEGWSSPIVYEDHVFLTTATQGGEICRVIALNRRDGEVLWDKEVFRQVPRRKERKNSYATPTPVTDGERVYAVFGDGSLAALSYEGEILWSNRDHQFYSQHGLGASPILYQDLLIMPYDGSSPGPDKKVGWKIPWEKAYILAVNKQTGEEEWKASRGKSRIAHVTPNVLSGPEGDRLISSAGDVIQGFDLDNGERRWTVHSQGEGVVPSVVLGNELVYTVSGFERPTIRAVRPGGQGEVTETHIAWEQTKGVPAIPSFIYWDPYLYSITEGGIATCYQADSGEIVWQDRVGGNHSASPVYAEGRIYFLSEEGDTTIIRAGSEFEVLARNSIDETCQASIAVSQGQLFIRSAEHLFCIGDERR